MKKNIVMIGIMLVLALVLIRGTKIQSVDEYYLTHMEDIQEDSETVTISIKCDTLRQPENWETGFLILSHPSNNLSLSLDKNVCGA